jgi:hypothetical protein
LGGGLSSENLPLTDIEENFGPKSVKYIKLLNSKYPGEIGVNI